MERRSINNKRQPENNHKFVNVITVIAFIALSTYFLSQTVRSVDITRQKLDIFDRAKEEVGDLRITNIKLILMSERVETEEYIEEEARNRLNYAKDGEILFIIPEELLSETDLDRYVNTFSYGYQELQTVGDGNISIWVAFFIDGL